MTIVKQAREGHGGHQPFETEDGSRYEVQTEPTWWGIRCENMDHERYLALLGFMIGKHAYATVPIDGIDHRLSLLKLSGVGVSFDGKAQEHRFGVYIHVTRVEQVDRDAVVRFTKEAHIELSLALGFQLPTNSRQEVS